MSGMLDMFILECVIYSGLIMIHVILIISYTIVITFIEYILHGDHNRHASQGSITILA